MATFKNLSLPPFRRRLRVLCFHGFRTNGDIMTCQINLSVFAHLSKHIEFVPLHGCHRCADESQVPEILKVAFGEQAPEIGYREWWNHDRATGQYIGLAETLAYVRAEIERSGPYDGVLGFSQGGALALRLVAGQLASGAGPGSKTTTVEESSSGSAVPRRVGGGGGGPRRATVEAGTISDLESGGTQSDDERANLVVHHKKSDDEQRPSSEKNPEDYGLKFAIVISSFAPSRRALRASESPSPPRKAPVNSFSPDELFGRGAFYSDFPTLFLGQEDDGSVPADYTEKASKFFQDSLCVRNPSGGHRIPNSVERWDEIQDWFLKRAEKLGAVAEAGGAKI